MAEAQYHSTRYTSWCPARISGESDESGPSRFDPLAFDNDDEGDMGYSYEDVVANYVESLAHDCQWTELEASCELLDQAGVAIEEICLTHGMPSALISGPIHEVDETGSQFHASSPSAASSISSTPRRERLYSPGSETPAGFSPAVSKFSRSSSLLASASAVPVIRTSRFSGGMKHSASVPALDSLTGNTSFNEQSQLSSGSVQLIQPIPATITNAKMQQPSQPRNNMRHCNSVPALNLLALQEHLPSVGQLIQPTMHRRLTSQNSTTSLYSNDDSCCDGRSDVNGDQPTLSRMPSNAYSVGGSSNYGSRVPSRVHSVADLQSAAAAAAAASPRMSHSDLATLTGQAKSKSFSQEFRSRTPTNRGERQGNRVRPPLTVGAVYSMDAEAGNQFQPAPLAPLAAGSAVSRKDAEIAALCAGNITSIGNAQHNSAPAAHSRYGSSSASGSGNSSSSAKKIGAVRSMKKMLASLFETERKMSVKVWTGGDGNLTGMGAATNGYGRPGVAQRGYHPDGAMVTSRNMPKELMRQIEMPVAQ